MSAAYRSQILHHIKTLQHDEHHLFGRSALRARANDSWHGLRPDILYVYNGTIKLDSRAYEYTRATGLDRNDETSWETRRRCSVRTNRSRMTLSGDDIKVVAKLIRNCFRIR